MGILVETPILMVGSPGNGSISSTSCGGFSEPSGGEPPHSGRIYGRKRGRPLRRGQQILVETLLPRLAIDLPRLFPNAPLSVWLEIGFGAGEHLTAEAEAHRDIGFIGCEVFENGIAK